MTETTKKTTSKWPLIIAGALAVHALAWVAVAYLATSNPTYAVEEDYYQKALAWDASQAQAARSAALGWQVEPTIERAELPGSEPVILLAITDRSGEPLEGATVSLEAFHNSRADRILRVVLESSSAGLYRAQLPMHQNGQWELRLAVTRGEDYFTTALRRYLVVR